MTNNLKLCLSTFGLHKNFKIGRNELQELLQRIGRNYVPNVQAQDSLSQAQRDITQIFNWIKIREIRRLELLTEL